MDQDLAHFGIKGMHWGVRRFQDSNGSLTSAGKERYGKDRKTKLTESVASRKSHVETMQKQAKDRIEFYGGKNAAVVGIRQEAKYKQRVSTAKTLTAGSFIATGAAYLATTATGSLPVAAISTVAIAAGTSFVAKRKNQKINAIANEQVAYTKDSDYNTDDAARKSRG